MSIDLLLKLFGLLAVTLIGYGAARMRAFGSPDATRVLSNAAFNLFAPALMFRTTARLDTEGMPWHLLLAYFLPVLAWMAVVRWVHLSRRPAQAAQPAVQAVTLGFGNSVQVGIPMAATVFGDAGLKLHLAIVSVHGLVLLGTATVWAELDLARATARDSGKRPPLWPTVRSTLRNAVIHPVVLPVLVGLAWNLAGLTIPGPLDDSLQMLGQAVVPLCLVLIGASLAQHGLGPRWRLALGLALLKLFALPTLVLVVAHWGFGLGGLPLAVVVIAAAMPTGSNALLFAQRYRLLEAEATAVIVLSTLLFALAVPVWLSVLGAFGSP